MQSENPRPSDSEVVQRVVGGDVNAFEILVKRHQALVLRIANRHLPGQAVEETAQEVFIQAYRSLPTFKGSGDFSHWLSAIAVRTCYNYWRQAYRKREIPFSALTEKHEQWLGNVMSAETVNPPVSSEYLGEARDVLEWALTKLSAEDRMVLELIYFEGHSIRETAQLLGWSVANVKVRSFRARKRLEKTLKEIIAKERRKTAL